MTSQTSTPTQTGARSATDRRRVFTRCALVSLAGVSLTAVAIGLAGAPVSAACTILDQPPGQVTARFAPFDRQINPGNPIGLDEPVVPSFCRPDGS